MATMVTVTMIITIISEQKDLDGARCTPAEPVTELCCGPPWTELCCGRALLRSRQRGTPRLGAGVYPRAEPSVLARRVEHLLLPAAWPNPPRPDHHSQPPVLPL